MTRQQNRMYFKTKWLKSYILIYIDNQYTYITYLTINSGKEESKSYTNLAFFSSSVLQIYKKKQTHQNEIYIVKIYLKIFLSECRKKTFRKI